MVLKYFVLILALGACVFSAKQSGRSKRAFFQNIGAGANINEYDCNKYPKAPGCLGNQYTAAAATASIPPTTAGSSASSAALQGRTCFCTTSDASQLLGSYFCTLTPSQSIVCRCICTTYVPPPSWLQPPPLWPFGPFPSIVPKTDGTWHNKEKRSTDAEDLKTHHAGHHEGHHEGHHVGHSSHPGQSADADVHKSHHAGHHDGSNADCAHGNCHSSKKKRSAQFYQQYFGGSNANNYDCGFGGCRRPFSSNQYYGGRRPSIGGQINHGYYGGFNFGGKRKRSAQFNQQYYAGSNANNYDCGLGGCKVPGSTQYFGGHHSNIGGTFNQGYNGGSTGINFGGKRKRSAQFYQQYHAGSNANNYDCGFGGCYSPGNSQYFGGYHTNLGSQFNQGYYGGSAGYNYYGK